MSQAEDLLHPVGALLRAFHVNERAFPIAEGRIPYSPHVFSALGYLADQPGARASDLAEFLGVRPTTASSLIARLVTRGLSEKRPHPKDGRAVALHLTAEGEDLFAAIRRQDVRNMELMLSALSAADRTAFIQMMHQVARVVSDAADADTEDQ
ncbi:MarR family winged helix-turn-helix transcriptional regulator [Gymnodinialimonas hymeniacidonis]|uniref:MarR family winged helix-turn-helix transcriptional regulator n=1 Tax=Gymnodinialimonas hymeniacidonis TaxID=3126508 RepID=UPI0034C661D7